MTTWTAESFVGGHPALDFVNTVGGRTKARSVEWLREFDDAIDWAHASELLDDVEYEQLQTLVRRDPDEADKAIADLRIQREALRDFLQAAIDDTDCPPDSRARVKADITTAHREARLSHRFRTQDAWVADGAELGLRLLTIRIALATAALLAGNERSQMNVCGRCSWLFLDPSPTGRRRWCSMATCGNRAKAERHKRTVEPMSRR